MPGAHRAWLTANQQWRILPTAFSASPQRSFLVIIMAADSLIRSTEPLLFYTFAALAVIGALWVVFAQQIVRMAVALLFTLGAVAFLYFLLEAEFLAAIQLIVYVGGTLILILFGVMLTTKGPDVRYPVSIEQRIAGWSIGLALFIVMGVAGLVGVLGFGRGGPALTTAADATVSDGDSSQTASATLEMLGLELITTYFIPLQLAAVLLLIVMIGAAYIAKGRHEDSTADHHEGGASR